MTDFLVKVCGHVQQVVPSSTSSSTSSRSVGIDIVYTYSRHMTLTSLDFAWELNSRFSYTLKPYPCLDPQTLSLSTPMNINHADLRTSCIQSRNLSCLCYAIDTFQFYFVCASFCPYLEG